MDPQVTLLTCWSPQGSEIYKQKKVACISQHTKGHTIDTNSKQQQQKKHNNFNCRNSTAWLMFQVAPQLLQYTNIQHFNNKPCHMGIVEQKLTTVGKQKPTR